MPPTVLDNLKRSWRVFKIAVLQFFTSIVDIGTDILNGTNYLNGGFGATVYFHEHWILQSGEDSDHGNFYSYGAMTLSLVWGTGLLHIPEMAMERDWRGTHFKTKVEMLAQHFLLLCIWPVFSALM